MKLSLVVAVLLGIGSVGLGGCSGDAAPSPSESAGSAVVDEAELTTPSFNTTYAPATPDDDFFFGPIAIRQVGSKQILHAGDSDFELRKTKSGALVFTFEENFGECDNPGCHFVTKISGVVFLRKVGAKRVPSVNLTITEDHPHPEGEGELEGLITTTFRFKKK